MRMVLLVSGFDGLNQRVWCALREAGTWVGFYVALAGQELPEMSRDIHGARSGLAAARRAFVGKVRPRMPV